MCLLADKLVELREAVSLRKRCVDAKKNALKPHLRQQWVIPPKADEAFVSCMEDVLKLYQRPRDVSGFPVVNMDEQPLQLLAEKRRPLPMASGRAMRVDYEYVRQGTASVFMFTEALRGWRKVSVRARRTAVDWAEEVKVILDEVYPDAERVLLICDNLNTHKYASLYKAFRGSRGIRVAESFGTASYPEAWELVEHSRD